MIVHKRNGRIVSERLESEMEMETPPTSQQIQGVTRAFIQWSKAGFPKRSRGEIKDILDKCKNCPVGAWKKDPKLKIFRCHQCGCTRVKHGWATEHCPIGEW